MALMMMMAIGPIAGGQVRADEVVALVPAYFYPTWWSGSPWDGLNAAAGQIPIEAIMNPASGPGTSVNPDYTVAVTELQAAGGTVIGYVATGYGSRAAADVLSDVQSYITWYGVNGIFLDQMGNQDGNLDYVSVYTSIKALAASNGIPLHVVGNPGIPFTQVEAYLAAADTLVIFEGPLQNTDPTAASFKSYPNKGPYTGLPLWFENYSPSQIANIVYSVPSALPTVTSIFKAVGYNAGYVYVTDGQLPNPYGALPSHWELEVDAIEFINFLLE